MKQKQKLTFGVMAHRRIYVRLCQIENIIKDIKKDLFLGIPNDETIKVKRMYTKKDQFYWNGGRKKEAPPTPMQRKKVLGFI